MARDCLRSRASPSAGDTGDPVADISACEMPVVSEVPANTVTVDNESSKENVKNQIVNKELSSSDNNSNNLSWDQRVQLEAESKDTDSVTEEVQLETESMATDSATIEVLEEGDAGKLPVAKETRANNKVSASDDTPWTTVQPT